MNRVSANRRAATSASSGEYAALLAAPASIFEAIPGAVYLCDFDGWVVRYNTEAAALWGRDPEQDGFRARFCGSHQLYLVDGTPLAHQDCPMAEAVFRGKERRNAEVVIERPNGSKVTVLVNIRPLRDQQGVLRGAINCFQDISVQKALEDRIQRTNADLEDFFENAAVGLHIVSGDGIIQRANRAELNMLGYAAEDYVGQPVAKFHADASVIDEILRRLAARETLDRYPARLRAKDGSIRHVLISSNSRFDHGEFVSTRCFTVDVTDQRQAEEARRESDARLAATYEAATVGIAETDETGRYVRVNDALCKILGRSREDAAKLRLTDITHPDDRPLEAEQYERQTRGEIDSYSLEKRAIRADGSIVHLQVSSSSVRDSNGSFRYGVRVLQDVTERKRMQQDIKASERRMRELLEALPAAVYTTDAEGRVTFYNQAAVELAGREPELNVDQWCVSWKLFWPDGTPLAHADCPMAITLKEGRAVRGVEAVAERPDGTRVPFIPFPTPLRNSDGELVGAINMLVDISDRKAAEARQKVLIDELNHRVKNTLATVQSLAWQTARHATDLAEFRPTFEARIVALARAHDLLTKRNWMSLPLSSLVQDIVTPYAGLDRLRVEGEDVDLDSRSALSMTMVLNELATNAAKYGALSRESGKLSICWQVEGGHLELRWLETGGPPVVQSGRTGFGTRLIERCVGRDLGGRFELQLEPSGVRCHLRLPAAVLASVA